MIRTLWIVILLLSLGFESVAQEKYGYQFLSGWIGYICFETDSGYTCFGLSNNDSTSVYRHRLFVNYVDESLKQKLKLVPLSSSLKYGNEYEFSSSFAVTQIDTGYKIAGHFASSNDTGFYATQYFLSDTSIAFTIDTIGSLSIYQAICETNTKAMVGNFDRVIGDEKFSEAFFHYDGKVKTTHACDFLPYCRLLVKQIVQLNDNQFAILSEARNSGPGGEQVEPYLFSVDSAGKILWTTRISNDSTWSEGPIMSVLENGHLLIMHCDTYWKSYKLPPDYDNGYPAGNDLAHIYLTEIGQNGEIISNKSLKKELRFIGNKYKYTDAKGAIKCRNGDIVFVGNIRDSGQKGFMLRIDEFGTYKWFRHIEINELPQDEKMFINGVTERSDGGFILAGEYRSHGDDGGLIEQIGIVILTDSFGCQTPNCHLTDGIFTPKLNKKRFAISPNPTNGLIEIKNIDNKYNIGRYNFQLVSSDGSVLKEGKLEPRLNINQSAGIYFLRIYESETGYWQVLKVSLIE
jgi:hypothetical protein